MWNFLLQHTPLFYFTQSLWRDEAFSILLAQRPLASFIKIIAFEPPFYYFLLHTWMKIFGTGEIAVRSLSLLGFTLACMVIIIWSPKLFRTRWLAWYLPLFFFANPMLLYYAFEIRTYGWYMFFSALSLYSYSERKFPLYIAATTLGLYTHTYMVFVPITQLAHFLILNKRSRTFKWKKILHDPFAQSLCITVCLYTPWIVKIISDFSRFKGSWYFPVDVQLIQSVLGNIFLGYEGTPWYLWRFTRWVSMVILASSCALLLKHRPRKTSLLFLLLTYLPLSIIIGVSLYKPLFVNRYVIPSTIGEIFILVYMIDAITNKIFQRLAAAMLLCFVVGFNIWYPGKYPKLDIRSTMMQINSIKSQNDRIMTDTPLLLFETTYYSSDRTAYWYNPNNAAFPWYVGDVALQPDQVVNILPEYPSRAFIIHADGTYDVRYTTPLDNTNHGTR